MNTSIQEWFRTMEVDQAEIAKVDFATTIDKAIREKHWTRKDFAASINASPAWVTKVLRGDVNLTIETMAKLAAAVGWELRIAVSKPLEKSATNRGTFSTLCLEGKLKQESYEFKLNRSEFYLSNDEEYLNAA
jgi:ribosome-binding protein aMBF1 (putative translation factor)